MISQAQIQSLFYYDGENLRWKIQRGRASIHNVAGTINSKGYRHIRIENTFYQAHRLIWIYVNGSISPELVIDHINRDKLDNRIENLRLVTFSENNANTARSDHYNVGVWKTSSGKYQSNFNCENKRHYLGVFETEEEAIAKRNEFINSLR